MDYPIRTLQQIRPLLFGFRKRAGLSQAEVAALLGVTQQTYAKVEANPAATSVDRLFTILRLLGSEIVLAQSAPSDDAMPAAAAPEPIHAAEAPLSKSTPKKSSVTSPSKVTPPSKTMEEW